MPGALSGGRAAAVIEAPIPSSGPAIRLEAGSFRDGTSRVFRVEDRIFRYFDQRGAAEYHAAGGLLADLVDKGQLVASQPIGLDEIPGLRTIAPHACVVVEHPRLPFISYAYEWSFDMLKAAALLQLDILRSSLERGMVLKDSSTYNIQFVGPRPIFIDVGSFEHRQDGKPWGSYAQFCRMFLNPLLLEARAGIEFQGWLRSSLEGIPPETLNRALPLRQKLSKAILMNVVMQAWLNRRFAASSTAREAVEAQSVDRKKVLGIVAELARFIETLKPARSQSEWLGYEERNGYEQEAREVKERFVEQAVQEAGPRLVWDLGCNTGAYSRLAARHAHWVVAMDSDTVAINAAYNRFRRELPNINPLIMDLLNPSPDQGWGQSERLGLERRGLADFVLCLALIHHLRIAGNVPFDQFFSWLARIALAGVIEFIPKDDPSVAGLLRWRPEVYEDYHRSVFEAAMIKHFHLQEAITLANGRVLYRFGRRGAP
jgi:hypothetical protein